MLESLSENLRATLSLLLQMDHRTQLRSMLLVLLFLFLANMASNAIYEALNLAWWVTPTALVAIVLLAVAGFGWQRRQIRPPALPRTGSLPAPHQGMLWCLSLFNAQSVRQANGDRGQTWRRGELEAALAADPVDWPLVIERCTHSNLQPAIEALCHHRAGGGGRHLWLVTTCDLTNGKGKVVQEGSRHLAPLVKRVLQEGLQWDVQVHFADPRLNVPPYDTAAAYAAAEYVFEEAARECGLAAEDVVADLTGGRVPTTSGIVLACAPRNWAMEYTTTDRDPVLPEPGETPQPLAIEVDAETLWWTALDAMHSKVDPGSR